MPIKSFAVGNGVSSGERWRVGVLEIVIMQMQGWSLLSSLTKKNPSCLESFKSEKKCLKDFSLMLNLSDHRAVFMALTLKFS